MASRPRSPRSLLALALVATTVAVASAGATLARGSGATERPADGTIRGSGAVARVISAATASRPAAVPVADYDRGPSLRSGLLAPRPGPSTAADGAAAPTTEGADWISRATTDTPAPRPRTESASEPVGGSGGSAPASFKGRNKVWIPALGIRRSVSFFSCSSNAYPGDRVYRWGCAGRNNIYLFGHAHSVFKPLHDAYVRGRLKKGMKVHFADGNGTVSTYSVVWWKVTTPDKGAFAYAGQSRPSMTLQTCVGAKSQYRLIVRLVRVG